MAARDVRGVMLNEAGGSGIYQRLIGVITSTGGAACRSCLEGGGGTRRRACWHRKLCGVTCRCAERHR